MAPSSEPSSGRQGGIFVFGVVNQPERVVIAEDEFSGGEIFAFPGHYNPEYPEKRAFGINAQNKTAVVGQTVEIAQQRMIFGGGFGSASFRLQHPDCDFDFAGRPVASDFFVFVSDNRLIPALSCRHAPAVVLNVLNDPAADRSVVFRPFPLPAAGRCFVRP